MAQYSAALRRAMLDASNAVFGASAALVLYSGPVPAYPDSLLGDDNPELARLAMSSTPFGLAASDVGTDATAFANNLAADPDAAATGKATFFRLVSGDGRGHVQGSISDTDDGADMTLNSAAIQIHAAVTVSGPTLVLPA